MDQERWKENFLGMYILQEPEDNCCEKCSQFDFKTGKNCI